MVDDEEGNIVTLSEMLRQYCPEVNICGAAANIQQGEELVKKYNPDLLFLDIEMPFGNGFELLDKLMPLTCEVVFITAYNQYAIKAFKYTALDYLLKPLSIEELKAAIEKVQVRMLQKKGHNVRVENLLSNIKVDDKDVSISLPVGNEMLFVPISSIALIEADGNYCNVYLADKKKILALKSLKDFQQMLPENIFLRVHHSSIVNINHIKKYTKGRGGKIEMKDGSLVEVSVRKKDHFMSILNNIEAPNHK